MAGFTSTSPDFLVRSEVWSTQLKEVLQDELMAQKYVNWLSEFPDGDTFTIPSISNQMQVHDYQEDTSVQYNAMDTGEFQFQITEYLSTGTYITNKQKQDAFYMSQLTSSFIPAQHRA